MAGVCIASTVLRPERLLELFLRYHLRVGFDHIFLFLDDPEDPSVEISQTASKVTVVQSTECYRSAQLDKARTLAAAGHARFIGEYPHVSEAGLIDGAGHTGLIVRQQLNLASALELARAKGFDWLLSIDVDEAFHISGQTLQEHFHGLSREGIRFTRYFNHEAVPEQLQIESPFEEVDLFLLNPRAAPSARTVWRNLDVFGGRPHFRAYANGKPAVHIGEQVAPSGSHRFRALNGEWLAAAVREFVDPCILHYAECGFQRFEQKYAELGDFGDEYFPGVPTVAWLRQCRDLWRSADVSRARSFYERHVVATPDTARTLLTTGLCRRFQTPANVLRPC